MCLNFQFVKIFGVAILAHGPLLFWCKLYLPSNDGLWLYVILKVSFYIFDFTTFISHVITTCHLLIEIVQTYLIEHISNDRYQDSIDDQLNVVNQGDLVHIIVDA